MMDEKEKSANLAAVVVACALVIASVVAVVVFYPSALGMPFMKSKINVH